MGSHFFTVIIDWIICKTSLIPSICKTPEKFPPLQYSHAPNKVYFHILQFTGQEWNHFKFLSTTSALFMNTYTLAGQLLQSVHLHMTSDWTRSGNFWFLSSNNWPLNFQSPWEESLQHLNAIWKTLLFFLGGGGGEGGLEGNFSHFNLSCWSPWERIMSDIFSSLISCIIGIIIDNPSLPDITIFYDFP